MLTIVRAAEWQAEETDWVIALPVRPLHHVAFAGQGWTGTRIAARSPQVWMATADETCFGMGGPFAGEDATLGLITDVPPALLAWRQVAADGRARATRAVLPRALFPRHPRPPAHVPLDAGWISEKLALGALDEVIGEIAGDILRGADAADAAASLLTALAAFPLLRSRALGALLAALCGLDDAA